MSVMLVVANAADVVPGRGLMAAVALVHTSHAAALSDLGIFLARNLLRHHLEVHHVVARRSLVALRAVSGAHRRMPELGDGPLGRDVALCAVFT